jgi:hypothetical protein
MGSAAHGNTGTPKFGTKFASVEYIAECGSGRFAGFQDMATCATFAELRRADQRTSIENAHPAQVR